MSLQQTPLIFALKHLYVQWEDADVASPSKFRLSASLMQAERRIPPASDAMVDGFLKDDCCVVVPHGVELRLLEMCFPAWPKDVALAFHGISTFGAGEVANAKACAHLVLKMHRECNLARQLVSLLAAKSEVRCPFGSDANDAPDVAAIVSTGPQ